MASPTPSNELKIIRVYDAPIKSVWEAWADPSQVGKWWGPRGFTITTHSKELKVGGHWQYTMHGPDATDYPNHTVYLEVEKYKRLVYDHGANDHQPALFRVRVNFSELEHKTLMDMTMVLANPSALEETKKMIKAADGNSTWDRLGEYLALITSGKEKFIINRSFDFDIETLFRAWTEPEQLVAWSGPIGARLEYIKVNIKTGGEAFYKMPFQDTSLYGKVKYLEVKPFEQLVYIQQFANQDETPGRHPLAPAWPQSMLTSVTFTKEGTLGTRITLEWEAPDQWSKEELATFIAGKKSMSEGWGGSFDKLEEYLQNKR